MDSHSPKCSLGGQEERAQSSSPLPSLCPPTPALLGAFPIRSATDSISCWPYPACPQGEAAQRPAPLPAAVPIAKHAQRHRSEACSTAEKRAGKGCGCLPMMLGTGPAPSPGSLTSPKHSIWLPAICPTEVPPATGSILNPAQWPHTPQGPRGGAWFIPNDSVGSQG